MRVAAIDIGTNSFLCLIAEKSEEGMRVVSDEIEMVRLGQGMGSPGKKILHDEALQRAEVCLNKFVKNIKALQVSRIQAVATSAARDAENKDKLIAICHKLSVPLKIISGEEEAMLTFKGAMVDQDEGSSMVIDIGGGSTEFLYLEGETLVGKSLNIGGVRLTEKFFVNDPPSPQEVMAVRNHVFSQLETLPRGSVEKDWVAVAGTPTTLAAIHLALEKFDEKKVHNLNLSLEDIEKAYYKLLVPLEERKKIVGLDPRRADIIIAASLILIEAMRFYKKKQIIISCKGIRYGLAKDLLS